MRRHDIVTMPALRNPSRRRIARSGQIGVDDRHQLLGRLGARVVARRILIDHMLADMVLDHLGDEPVERAPARGRLLQHARALGIRLDRALDRLELPAQPFQPVEQLLLLARDVAHPIPVSALDRYPPRV